MENHREIVSGFGDAELMRRYTLCRMSLKNWHRKKLEEGSEFHQENCQREIDWWMAHYSAVVQECYSRKIDTDKLP